MIIDESRVKEESYKDTQELMASIITLINEYNQKPHEVLPPKTRFLISSRALNGAWLRWNFDMGRQYDRNLKEIEETK